MPAPMLHQLPRFCRRSRNLGFRRTSAAVAAALLVTVGLAACGDDDTDTVAAPSFTGTTADSPEGTTPVTGQDAVASGAVDVVHDDDDDDDDDDDTASGSRDVSAGTTCADGEDVTVSSDDAVPMVEGRCGTVTIDGDGVHGYVEHAESVLISGDNTSVRGTDWGSLSIDGDQNTVLSGSVGHLVVTGDQNTVNWDEGVAAPDRDTGEQNTYTR